MHGHVGQWSPPRQKRDSDRMQSAIHSKGERAQEEEASALLENARTSARNEAELVEPPQKGPYFLLEGDSGWEWRMAYRNDNNVMDVGKG